MRDRSGFVSLRVEVQSKSAMSYKLSEFATSLRYQKATQPGVMDNKIFSGVAASNALSSYNLRRRRSASLKWWGFVLLGMTACALTYAATDWNVLTGWLRVVS